MAPRHGFRRWSGLGPGSEGDLETAKWSEGAVFAGRTLRAGAYEPGSRDVVRSDDCPKVQRRPPLHERSITYRLCSCARLIPSTAPLRHLLGETWIVEVLARVQEQPKRRLRQGGADLRHCTASQSPAGPRRRGGNWVPASVLHERGEGTGFSAEEPGGLHDPHCHRGRHPPLPRRTDLSP